MNCERKVDLEIAESTYIIHKIEDSIIYATYKKSVTIDLEAAIEISRARRKFLRGRSYPGLADIRHIKFVTKEARAFLEKEATLGPEESGVTAIAVLVKNRLTVFIANLFAKVVRPKIPTKTFITMDQALIWLDHYRNR